MLEALKKWCANKHNLSNWEGVDLIDFEVVDIGGMWESIHVCSISFIYKEKPISNQQYFEIKLDKLTPIEMIQEILKCQ